MNHIRLIYPVWSNWKLSAEIEFKWFSKQINFQLEKLEYLRLSFRQSFKRYRCELEMLLYKWKVTWKYGHIPLKVITKFVFFKGDQTQQFRP